MNKFNFKKSGPFFAIILVIVVFGLYFLVNRETPIFTASMLDSNGDVVSSQSLNKARSLEITQAAFDIDYTKNVLVLQAAQPIGEGDQNLASFTLLLENPFMTQANLVSVTVLKNGVQERYKEFVSTVLQKGESYEFTTDAIDLNGAPGQKNVVRIEATFVDPQKTSRVVVYEYQYLSLSTCSTDLDCPNLNPVCDVSNGARLSKELNTHYCVRICNNHNECNLGQLCLAGGYCGY